VAMETPSAGGNRYAVVHLVVQESMKGLIASQVIDHMRIQQEVRGVNAPERVGVVFLDAARTAISTPVRRRVKELRERAAPAFVLHAPIATRMPMAPQARLLAHRLRGLTKGVPIVFHCRTETPIPWAMAMRRILPEAGIVLDVRGAWPEEYLFYKGFDGPAEADDDTLRGYHHHLANLHRGIEHAGAILSVSAGMLEWLQSLGVPERRLTYVPCCVTGVTYDPERRARARRQLGYEDALVFAYMGTITPYQHIEDGVATFFLAAHRRCPAARLLCITDDPDTMRATMLSAGVPANVVTIERRPQAEVADLLVAADCGLILRAPSRINEFSQPTKLGEYLAAGVPVVVSRATGRVGEILETAGAGLSIEVFDISPTHLEAEAQRVCATVQENHGTLRDNALQLCRSSFQWTSYLDRVREAYGRALGRTASSGVTGAAQDSARVRVHA